MSINKPGFWRGSEPVDKLPYREMFGLKGCEPYSIMSDPGEEPANSGQLEDSREPCSGSIMPRPSTSPSNRSSNAISISEENFTNEMSREQRLEHRFGRASATRRSMESQGDIMLQYTYVSASTKRRETYNTDYTSSHSCKECSVI